MNDIYYTYLLRCWRTRRGLLEERPLYGHIIYCGFSHNIFERVLEHIKGKTKRYTKQFKGNIRLSYIEIFKTRAEAMKREDEIKALTRDERVKMIYDFKEKYPEILEYLDYNIQRLLIL